MSDYFLQSVGRRNMLQKLKSFSYIGLWAPQSYLRHVVKFIGSIEGLEVFRFSLQTMFPLLDDPLQTVLPVNQQDLAAAMQESYPEMMYIFNSAAELADTLGMESCFDSLRQVVCLDSSEVVDFGTIHEPVDAWYWMNDDTASHALVRLENSRHRQIHRTSPF